MRLSLGAMIAVVLVSLSPCAFSQQPHSMTRIVFHEERGAQPVDPSKQVYRKVLLSGDTLFRAEMLEGGLTKHMLIRNGTELWEANPLTKTAVLRDTAVHTMSLSLMGNSKQEFVRGLQIGREMEYFKTRKAKLEPDEKIDTIPCSVYSIDTAGTQLRLWVDKKRQVPVQITITNSGGEYRVRYDVYLTDVPFDPTVFRVPSRPQPQSQDTSGASKPG